MEAHQGETWIDEVTGYPMICIMYDGELRSTKLANIIYAMEYNAVPAEGVILTCGNKCCLNVDHMQLLQ